ncbi:UDP-glucuronate 4-epimerase 3 [Tanacetum coccineum]|uniref:UDP-glucuronate 4-epimerase 3 n=1 Tax=Tanacetum coccineum TaxID=301880 RepID=A0ABQ5GR47_9ASTR
MKLQSSSSIHMNDNNPSTPGKFKMDKSFHNRFRFFHYSSLAKLTFWSFIFLALILVFFFKSPTSSSSSYPLSPSMMTSSKPSMTSSLAASDLYRRSLKTSSWGGPTWEKRVKSSARVRTRNGFCVLVTGASGFVGTHVSVALKRRGDGVLGLDNFNDYYEPSLKRARQALLERSGVYVVEGDINDVALLKKLFELVSFSHVMHLAAQAGVRYAMQNPSSYIHSNIAGFVNLLEICKSANPQPAIVWASSSSVYGLNTKVPFSEKDRTDQPASLYAATKKAGEEIAHTYNHIYGLSLTGVRVFFTVYGVGGVGGYGVTFSVTKDILEREADTIFRGAIDLEKEYGSGWEEAVGPPQLRFLFWGIRLPGFLLSDLVSYFGEVVGKLGRNVMVI